MKLTIPSVEKIEPPASGQAFYRDDELRGFALRVTAAGTKAYIVEKLVGRKVRRITIGRTNVLSADTARKRAKILLGKIADGRDPVEEKAIEKARSATLSECFEAYLSARKELKPRTVKLYRSILENYDGEPQEPIALADWKNKPLIDITPDMVERRHKKLGEERGEAWANLTMRVLRALFFFAEEKYQDAKGRPILASNPVKRLSRAKAWYNVERRQTIIKQQEFKPWYEAVSNLESATGRDYLLTVLLTGLRREEAARLRWSDIDLKDNTLRVADTKNGRAHVLPLSTQLSAIFKHRQTLTGKSQWVFPGHVNGAPIAEPRVFTDLVTAASGVRTTIHDLRRTFATTAESLDIPVYALKRLLNHKDKTDVTAGYVVTDIERLRRPMQLVSDYLWRVMGAAECNVVAMGDAAHASA